MPVLPSLPVPDAVFLLGDLDGAERAVLEAYPGVPVFGVPGNHDAPDWPGRLPVTNLHGRVEEFRGIRVAGLGGCLLYAPRGDDLSWRPGDPWLFWDREYRDILAPLPPAEVVISHCPSRGIPGCDPWVEVGGRKLYHDAWEGSLSLQEYLGRSGTRLLVCGHVHEYARGRVEGTDAAYVRVFGAAFIAYDPGQDEADVLWASDREWPLVSRGAWEW